MASAGGMDGLVSGLDTQQVQTRAQQDLKRAVDDIQKLIQETASDSKKDGDKSIRESYESRAKDFAVLVMSCGLAQALAFCQSKRESDKAYAYVIQHVASILDENDVVNAVRSANTSEYMHMTRRVLAAWVYYRRFAESMLGNEKSAGAK